VTRSGKQGRRDWRTNMSRCRRWTTCPGFRSWWSAARWTTAPAA
jgi:hypothetical protein